MASYQIKSFERYGIIKIYSELFLIFLKIDFKKSSGHPIHKDNPKALQFKNLK
jgi:hypothetical protein